MGSQSKIFYQIKQIQSFSCLLIQPFLFQINTGIFYLEGFKIRREIEQEKRYIVFNIDLKKQQDIYSKISQKSSDIKSIKSILKAHSESLLENCIQIDLKKQTLNSKINQTQLILASVKKIQRLWRIKLSKDRLITLTKKKKRLQQNRNPIKKTILFKDFYYYQVLIYYNNKCFTIKAYQLPLQFLFSGSVQDIEENFRFCKEGETKIDYLLKRTSFNYNKQEIVFDLSENAVIQNQNSLSQIEAPRKQISYDLIVTYQNDKKNIQNYREISQSVENSALKDSIEENKIFQTSNKKKVGNNSLQSIKKHERKKTEEVIQVNVDLKKINKQYDPLSCGSNKNVSEAQIQEIVSEIAKSIQVFEDGSVIMDCLNSINSTAITIKKGLQNPSNYNSSQSFDNNKNFKSLVPCTSKVNKLQTNPNNKNKIINLFFINLKKRLIQLQQLLQFKRLLIQDNVLIQEKIIFEKRSYSLIFLSFQKFFKNVFQFKRAYFMKLGDKSFSQIRVITVVRQNEQINKQINNYIVQISIKVLKKGYLYSESKQRHTIFIKEWQEDQSSFLRIQTDQAYYECQKYYTIEVINQHSNNSINWRLSYYQFETLLYGSNLRDCSTTFERALFNFYKSFLIFQKTLIIEVDDDRDISILNNRPSQVLLLNKKHVRAFQSNVRVKLGAMKVNKARAEWNSLKSKIISQFLYRCEHQYLQNKEEDQYNNNTCYDQIQLITSPSLVQQQSEDQDNYQYFKFILYEKCDEKYFIKCWDLSNYSCFEKELKIKNLRQIFLLKLIDITPVVQQNTTINFHNISLEMSQFFNNQSEELSRNGQIQYYLNQFLIQIDLQRIKSEIKQAFKKQRQK